MKIKYFPTKSSVINITRTRYVLVINKAYIRQITNKAIHGWVFILTNNNIGLYWHLRVRFLYQFINSQFSQKFKNSLKMLWFKIIFKNYNRIRIQILETINFSPLFSLIYGASIIARRFRTVFPLFDHHK